MFDNDFDDISPGDDDLDRRISVQEIENACKLLKRGKAYDTDLILNEYLIESCNILSSHLCDIFNAVLDNWSEGVIVPLHKKGDLNDTNR